MKTDTLFYELFQVAPQTFFELMQITPRCSYRFESVTVKTSEKRIDGVLEPSIQDQPIYFLEVQAFPDATSYWRVLREVSTYFEQRSALLDSEWFAIVLWLNQENDLGLGTLELLGSSSTPRLISSGLVPLLHRLQEQSLVLNVLRPLLAESEDQVMQNVVQWVESIRQVPELDWNTEEKLISVMAQLIAQKFKTLTYKELSIMLQLTPLEETASGQELLKTYSIDMLLMQIQQKFTVSDKVVVDLTAKLEALDLDTLKALMRNVITVETLDQLELWIDQYASAVNQ